MSSSVTSCEANSAVRGLILERVPPKCYCQKAVFSSFIYYEVMYFVFYFTK